MTEAVMITLIICVTVAFCIFFICGAFSASVKKLEAKMIEASDFIDREEFEEYEHMINGRFSRIENELREKR